MTPTVELDGVSEERLRELVGILAGGSPSDDDCVDAACALKLMLEKRIASQEIDSLIRKRNARFAEVPVCGTCLQKLRQIAPEQWECVRCP